MEKPLRQAIKPFLDDLRDRKITGREVARRLNVSESVLSRAVKRAGIVKLTLKPEKIAREEQRQLRQARNEYRKLVATTLTVKEAARAANCHPRTIRRLLEKL